MSAPPQADTFAEVLDALDETLDAACAQFGFPRSEAIVGGFSQGAGLALALALRSGGEAHPAGALAMSPFLPGLDGLEHRRRRGREDSRARAARHATTR